MAETEPATQAQTGVKRKRSVIACNACHQRKVRCNVAFQGVPCTNCTQDNVKCEIYKRKIGIPGQRSIRPRQFSADVERAYPLTPSPPSTRERSNSSVTGRPPELSESNNVNNNDVAQIVQQPESSRVSKAESMDQEPENHDIHLKQPPGRQRFDQDVAPPFYAGESEGLEFLFDQCSPDRPLKGTHYLVAKKIYRRKRSTSKVRRLEPPYPPSQICQELIRCFFHYVYPLQPIIDAKDFLERYQTGLPNVSPLLLWSIFFCALNFIGKDVLKAYRMPPRKIFKEQCYQNAKDIYDNQDEEDKTVLIQAAMMLSSWYVDHEDRDGTWYWMGTAISLCQTMGLHRAPNYAAAPNCPFPICLQRVWRRIWWTCFHREAWVAMGFGRPMRVFIDDCDQLSPTIEDVLAECAEIPTELRQLWLPNDMHILTDCWVNQIHLSIIVAEILTTCYRPRSPLPDPAVLRRQELEIMELRSRLPATNSVLSPLTLLHVHHLEFYYNSVLLVLYRPYLACDASKLVDRAQIVCQQEAITKARATASESTNILNKLMSSNKISQTPSTFLAATMPGMQVLTFEIRNSTGLAKNYAQHQLDLYMLVLSSLRKTYWTADLQHILFSEVMKTMNAPTNADNSATPAHTSRDHAIIDHREHTEPDDFHSDHTLGHASFEDFFMTFHPFLGMNAPTDELSTSVDWELSPSSHLGLDSVHSRMSQ